MSFRFKVSEFIITNGLMEFTRSRHVVLFPSAIVFRTEVFDPKKKIGKVRYLKEPIAISLNDPLKYRCRSFKLSEGPSNLVFVAINKHNDEDESLGI